MIKCYITVDSSVHRHTNMSTKYDLSKKQHGTYKNLNHRSNYCKLVLSGNIEVNPGPTFVNPSKTIFAPYSQGSIDVFGENAGRQCVAMSLYSLIHTHCNGSVTNSSALVEIMNLGNELYSMLSRLSRQHYLLLTELPTLLTIKNIGYSLEFSNSYTGNVHLNVPIINFPFVMPLNSALEQLQHQQFNSFLLTIECNTISIFIDNNSLFKVFYSHSRDLFGMPHPHGSCVLLEFDSLTKFMEYLMFMYRRDVIYELKGVKVINYNLQLEDIHMNDIPINRSTGTINHGTSRNCITSADVDYMSNQNSILCTQESFIYIYSICFSTIMTCAYWTYETQTAIIESAIEIYNAILNFKNQNVLDHFPPSITICGAKIDISYTSRHQGALCRTSLSSKLSLESVWLMLYKTWDL